MSCNGGIGHIRHWFTVYRSPGLRTPVCIRYGCGAPNPRPLTGDEWDELIAYRDRFGPLFIDGVEDAIAAYQGQQAS